MQNAWAPWREPILKASISGNGTCPRCKPRNGRHNDQMPHQPDRLPARRKVADDRFAVRELLQLGQFSNNGCWTGKMTSRAGLRNGFHASLITPLLQHSTPPLSGFTPVPPTTPPP